MHFIGTLSIVLAALTASAQAPVAWDWSGPIQPRQTVEIRNINGDIRAEASTGSEVEISVVIVGTRPDPNTVRIDLVPYHGGVLACTVYEGLSNPDHCTPETTPSVTLTNSDIRVHYTVRLPAGVNFKPKTVNGRIFAELAENSISANAVNGRIVLSSGQPSDAHVVNGSILATLTNVEWTGTREFASVNGAVDVELPESCQASVRAQTVFGYVANDFGIRVHHYLIGSWFAGDINGGGPSLLLGTVNGSIHLRNGSPQ